MNKKKVPRSQSERGTCVSADRKSEFLIRLTHVLAERRMCSTVAVRRFKPDACLIVQKLHDDVCSRSKDPGAGFTVITGISDERQKNLVLNAFLECFNTEIKNTQASRLTLEGRNVVFGLAIADLRMLSNEVCSQRSNEPNNSRISSRNGMSVDQIHTDTHVSMSCELLDERRDDVALVLCAARCVHKDLLCLTSMTTRI